MNINTARSICAQSVGDMNYEKLLKHRVKVIDAWINSRAEYGFNEAVRNGFYVEIASESASGYSPKDLWLTRNLGERLSEVEALLQKKYARQD